MKGLVVIVPDQLSPETQGTWQTLASENGPAHRILSAEQISEVPPRDVVAVACGLEPGQRQFPGIIRQYLREALEEPPYIIAHCQEALVEPIVSLDEGRILLCAPTVNEAQLRAVLLHLLRLHPLAFRVIDSDAGEIQVDHSSNEWWVSCRREANLTSPWP
jgi:hypothetical protein